MEEEQSNIGRDIIALNLSIAQLREENALLKKQLEEWGNNEVSRAYCVNPPIQQEMDRENRNNKKNDGGFCCCCIISDTNTNAKFCCIDGCCCCRGDCDGGDCDGGDCDS